jgi:uncharacterized membrane protein YheB (UPF0754 family)
MNLITKIQMFFGNQRLVDSLKRTVKLLEQSEDSDWTNLTVKEITAILEREIHKLKENQGFDKLELATLYAPTGYVQETAMANNWHREYLEIAKTVDKFTR